MRLPICVLYLLFIFTNCAQSANTQPSDTEGCISSRMDKYSNEKIPSFSSTDTVWFKGNEVITQIRGIYFNTDTAGVFTITEYLMHYAYINYDTRQFALYSSFSDTATCLKQYPTLDSLAAAVVTNYFENSKKPIDFVVKTEIMKDTVIGNIMFQRKKYYKRWKEKDFISIVYLRCDKPNSNFSIAKNPEDSCSIVKMFNYKGNEMILTGSVQTDFLSDALSKQERIVFEAWRKQLLSK